MQVDYRQAIQQLDLLNVLEPFQPMVIGTPPLEIAVPGSDIDIACSCSDLQYFIQYSNEKFSALPNFQSRQSVLQDLPSVIVSFIACQWQFELFCQTIPTQQQWGVRHFQIQQRLFSISPELRETIIRLKRAGLKTEPAFAQVLQLEGDPYVALLQLETLNDDQLKQLMHSVEN